MLLLNSNFKRSRYFSLTPQGSTEHHTIIRLSHSAYVTSIIANVEISSTSFLFKPDVRNSTVLEVRYSKRPEKKETCDYVHKKFDFLKIGR